MSKLGDYLKKHKIDPRRVASASKELEALQPEDRVIRLARKEAATDESKKELAAKKRRSGRSLSRPTMNKALAGGKLTRKARARVVRAVNAVLSHKSKATATHADLF
jgi:hypothetical protein